MNTSNNQLHFYNNVHVVVLGATGFIGRWVAYYLSKHRANLSLIVRNKLDAAKIFSKYQVNGEIFEIDLHNLNGLREFYHDCRPVITFNLAGYGIDRSERDDRQMYQINSQLVNDLCEIVKQNQNTTWQYRDIVHVGSALEYGDVSGNLSEDTVPNPTTVYGKSKLSGTNLLQKFCKTNKVNSIIVRLFTVYGPGEHSGRLLPSLLDSASNHKPLPLTKGDQKRDFTYVEDVAEGLLRLGLTKAEEGRIINLATGKLTSVRRFVETAADMLRINPDLLQFNKIPTRDEEMKHDDVDISNLQELTGWQPPTSIEEGIIKTRRFFYPRVHVN